MNLKRIWISGSAAVIALLITGCSSGFTKLESIEQRKYIAVYTLDAEVYPDADDIRGSMSPTKQMPALSAEQIRRVFGALKFRKKSIWGIQTRPVFYKQELAEIAPTLSQAIVKMKPNQRLVFITRYDPDQSVMSRMERVTGMLWADDAGLNLILGEIRHEIPLNDFLEQDEWTEILPISMRRSFPYYALVNSPDYELKKINGFTHGTWAIYNPENLDNIHVRTSRTMTLDEKEKLLREALDNRLMTRKEYEAKRLVIEQERRARLLREALNAGLLSPGEYDRKLRDIYKGGEPPREFLRVKPRTKVRSEPANAVDPEPVKTDDKKKPLVVDEKKPAAKKDEIKKDAPVKDETPSKANEKKSDAEPADKKTEPKQTEPKKEEP